MNAKKVDIPQDKLEAYNDLIAGIPEIKRKGVTNPYTSVNGHMFSHLSKEGTMGLRLPEDEREAFLEKYKTTQPVQYGTVMKEYVNENAGPGVAVPARIESGAFPGFML